MAGQWEDWFEREEFIGQISDLRVQNLQVEREVVQKRTFTRWMNLHLEKCDPPIEVHDLFQDIQDGRILMALLEELSGCKLLHGFKKSSHRIFRLNNIAKVLSFLEERNVKLVSIDAVDVADGNSSIILGLIWNIILFFQIKELTGNIRSQFPSCSSLSSIPTSSDSDASFCSTPSDERQSASTAIREHSKAIKKLLQWVQKRTRKYGVAVQDFGKSWTTGLAFLAVIKSIDSTLVDMRKALLRNARENLEDAFRIAHYSLGIPRLLEPEDVTINSPDEQSIIMYVSQFLEHFPGIEEPEESYQIIERSVSMGRLNFRDSDSYHLNNGLHRSRVKERSQMFQKDGRTKAPPKILISSVSEDRSVMSPTFKVAAARSWSSEDFLADSSQVENEEPKKPTSEVVNDPLTSTHSPTGSSIPESANAESLIGDSAISSPDSWVESEFNVMPDKFSESRSDSSLCDSGTAWDVYRATPVDVTPHDEGFVPSLEDGAADEQSLPESYIDEGIYSLSSLESTQYKVQEKKEEEEVKDIEKDLVNHREDQAAEQSQTETRISQQITVSHQKEDKGLNEQAPSFESSNAEDLINSTDQPKQIELSCNGSPSPADRTEKLVEQNSVDKSSEHKLRESVDFSQEVQTHEGQVKGQTDSLQQLSSSVEFGEDTGKTDSPSENTTEGSKDGLEMEKKSDESSVKIQNESSEELLNFSPDSSQALENSHTTNQDETSDTRLEKNLPLISISSASQEQVGEETCDSEGQAHAVEDEVQQRIPENEGAGTDVNTHQNPANQTDVSGEIRDQIPDELPPCLVSIEIRPILLEQIREIDEHSSDTDERNVGPSNADGAEAIVNLKLGEVNQECESLLDKSQTDVTVEASATQTKTQLEENQRNEHQDKVSDISMNSKTDIAQQDILVSVTSKQEAEMMELPANEQTESTEKDLISRDFERRSPTADLAGGSIEPMDLFYPDKEESMFTEPPDTEMQSWPSVLSVSALEPAPASEMLPDEQPISLLGDNFRDGLDSIQEEEKVIPETDSPSETQDLFLLNPICTSENTEPVRSDTITLLRQDESLSAPVLRHRKGARSTESTDNQRTVSRKGNNEDSDFWWSENWELCLLLLLWLLLYCFWVLPQMDLKTLPGLLLNNR